MIRRTLAILLALSFHPALAAPPDDPVPPADVSAVKDKLTIWSDGKKHYLALVLTSQFGSPIFWSGDGQRFYQLRVTSGASDGYDDDLKRLDRNFWEPRQRGGEAGLGYLGATKKLDVQCVDRHTAMERLPDTDARKMIDGAQFYKSLWNHVAYGMARDDTGKYYYVDNVREPEGAKKFRLFVGPRGGVKPQKMLNIVSDTEGDIFSTARGDLRLILSKKDSTWVAKEKKTQLTWVNVDDNAVLIYTDLGVYTGQRLGTPCDEL
jgi:hypothetical protein